MPDDIHDVIHNDAAYADLFKADWLAKFIARFSQKMRLAGYDNEPDLAKVAAQHAEASWGCRDADDTAEATADGEFDALADSV